jgi:serine protease
VRHATARLINSVVLLALLLGATLLLGRAYMARAGEMGSEAAALPEVQAHADFIPDDPGTAGHPAGWAGLQWNFAGPSGVDAPAAWDNLIAAGAPGGAGVTVAVVDTGIAYEDRYPYRRSPDLSATRFVPGYDFIGGDPYPFDLNGHGTHVASTIAEETNNTLGVTGLAYGVQLMPVRVLNRYGAGSPTSVARGIRFAADHGADVINVSLSFNWRTTARQIPQVVQALDYAQAQGSLVVASAGNTSRSMIPYPARRQSVLAVGATTEHGCLASFSNFGPDLDLVAPGGGTDARLLRDPSCRAGRRGRSIYQLTLRSRSVTSFGLRGFAGTSMATPHVSATAALVIASGVLGADPSPATIAERLAQTTRDHGSPGYDTRYGWGLVNAAAATATQPPGLR